MNTTKSFYKIFLIVLIFSVFSIATTGCASIVNGQNQPISVNTSSVEGASCELQNDKGKWYVPSTPGSVTVHRSYNDLNITCKKKGFKSTYKKVASSTKAMAFGNIIFGGAIGAGIDMADGSAYDYPKNITLVMGK